VNGELTLDGVVASIDGQSLVRDQVIGAVDRAADLGRQLAEQLQGQGAAALLAESS
jgi:hydroxymethylbilane synthase